MPFKLLISVTLLLPFAIARTPWDAEAGNAPWIPNDAGPKWWRERHEALLNTTRRHASEIKAIFLGDSITDYWQTNGKAVWTAHYANRGAFNYGLAGDRTENVLYRIQHGEFDDKLLKPKVVVLMIGVNNVGTNPYVHDKPADIAKGVRAILDQLHAKLPGTSILILSVIPEDKAVWGTVVPELNRHLATFADGKIFHYFNLGAHFKGNDGEEKAELFVDDHIHLTAKGYEVWQKEMEPTFAKLLNSV